MAGFLTAEPAAYGIGIALLGGGFAVFLAAAAISLARAVAGVTVNGIRLRGDEPGRHPAARAGACPAARRLVGAARRRAAIAAHVSFGLLGWVLLLVIGVAYQVVPMFQLTPPYPPRLEPLAGRRAVRAAAAPRRRAAVFAKAARVVDAGLAGGILLFAVATLRLQARRRRKLPTSPSITGASAWRA
jgi:hypothetical protein